MKTPDQYFEEDGKTLRQVARKALATIMKYNFQHGTAFSGKDEATIEIQYYHYLLGGDENGTKRAK